MSLRDSGVFEMPLSDISVVLLSEKNLGWAAAYSGKDLENLEKILKACEDSGLLPIIQCKTPGPLLRVLINDWNSEVYWANIENEPNREGVFHGYRVDNGKAVDVEWHVQSKLWRPCFDGTNLFKIKDLSVDAYGDDQIQFTTSYDHEETAASISWVEAIELRDVLTEWIGRVQNGR